MMTNRDIEHYLEASKVTSGEPWLICTQHDIPCCHQLLMKSGDRHVVLAKDMPLSLATFVYEAQFGMPAMAKQLLRAKELLARALRCMEMSCGDVELEAEILREIG